MQNIYHQHTTGPLPSDPTEVGRVQNKQTMPSGDHLLAWSPDQLPASINNAGVNICPYPSRIAHLFKPALLIFEGYAALFRPAALLIKQGLQQHRSMPNSQN